MELTPELLAEFIAFLKIEYGGSPHTIAAYHNDLSKFIAVCHELPSPITPHRILEFLKQEQQRGLAPASVARRLASIKSFFPISLRRGLVRAQSSSDSNHPQVMAKNCRWCLVKKKSKNYCCKPPLDTALGVRDRALLEFLYATGARISEALWLQQDGVDSNSGYVKLLGKGQSRTSGSLRTRSTKAIMSL